MSDYRSFAEFYPFYLGEHSDRRMATGEWLWLAAMPFCGYGFAWVGHFFFEKNRPATFKYPVYSLMGDWVMFWQILTGKIAF
jgi:hypothetical protein